MFTTVFTVGEAEKMSSKNIQYDKGENRIVLDGMGSGGIRDGFTQYESSLPHPHNGPPLVPDHIAADSICSILSGSEGTIHSGDEPGGCRF